MSDEGLPAWLDPTWNPGRLAIEQARKLDHCRTKTHPLVRSVWLACSGLRWVGLVVHGWLEGSYVKNRSLKRRSPAEGGAARTEVFLEKGQSRRTPAGRRVARAMVVQDLDIFMMQLECEPCLMN